MPQDARSARIGAVEKVVRVASALADHSRVTEIARATGIPVSSVHRIVTELVELGWARPGSDRGYLPGAALLAFAGRATSTSGLTTLARPALERLRDTTTHTVHLAMRMGDRVVYVDKIEGQRAYEMRSRVGLELQLHSTAIGKALIAALPEAERRALIHRVGMPPITEHTIVEPERLLAHAAEIGRAGFAIDDQENELHTRCVGAAVRDHRGAAIGGVSVSAMAFELDQEAARRIAPLVVETAGEISRLLGAPG